MIVSIFLEEGFVYLKVKPHLEEVGPAKVVQVFRACLHMIQKYLCWKERMAKLALIRSTMLETFGIGLIFSQLLLNIIIPILLFANRFTQHSICILQLLQLFF